MGSLNLKPKENDEKDFEEIIKTIPDNLIGYPMGKIWVNIITPEQKRFAKWVFLACPRKELGRKSEV
jgi:hypothetical protein